MYAKDFSTQIGVFTNSGKGRLEYAQAYAIEIWNINEHIHIEKMINEIPCYKMTM
jgi:hypothetical protein